jgi:hypothetical protein
MQTELNELYKQSITGAYQELMSVIAEHHLERLTHPLLICTHKEYEDAKVKIMFFGQETNDWYGEWQTTEVDALVRKYHDFFCSGYCYTYGRHFWNGIGHFSRAISGALAEDLGLLWNNIVKIGKCGTKGRPSERVIGVQFKRFNVFTSEIRITRPDKVLFFTGPYYDDLLAHAFPGVRFTAIRGWPSRALSRLEADGLPGLALRTYHPNFLWRNRFHDYLDAIANEIVRAPV